MTAIASFLAYHGINPPSTSAAGQPASSSTSAIVHGRRLIFVANEKGLAVESEKGTIQLTGDELERVGSSLLCRYRPVDDISDVGRPQGIKADDIGIRLSLCFPGDVVEVHRRVYFPGAGIQSNPEVRIVV